VRCAALHCDECGVEIDLNLGVCTGCGLVFEDRPVSYDLGFDGDERKEPIKPLTVLSWDDPDISIKTYHDNKTTDKRLKHAFRTEKRTQTNLLFGRGYLNAHNEIRRLCNILNLNKNIQNNAIWLLRKLTIEGYIQKNYKKYATYPALIMIAARHYTRYPLRFLDISKCSDESTKNIKKAYEKIRKKLVIGSNPFYLEEIVQYDCGKLGLSYKVTQDCVKFAKKVKVESGRDLYGYSAAVIKKITQKTRKYISKLLNISEPVITARERELRRIDT